MADPQDPRAPKNLPVWLLPVRAAARFILSIFLLLWTLLELLLFPLVRPLLDALGRLRLFELLAAGLGRLPPYAALLALAVPFVIIEPFKVFALYWLGLGHLVQGSILFVASHLASLLIVERVYHAAHAPLMRIGWFERLMTWLVALRRLATDWAKSTALWQAATALARSVRTTVRGWIRAIR
jgi:hypothetical protein